MKLETDLDIQVGSIGPKRCRIAFVGQAPGAEEILAGEPFVGPAGQELNRELSRVGIRQADCYITNVCKRKLAQNDIKPLYANASCTMPKPELQAWWDLLHKELEEVKANVVVALGYDALIALTGLVGIGKYRGSIVASLSGRKIVPTYHPSGVLQNYSCRPLVIADLKKAKRESLYPDIILPKREFIIEPTLKEIKIYLKECRRKGIASVDIETQRTSWISCIGFSHSPDSALCIPLVGPEGDYWGDELDEVKREISAVLGDESVKIVGQNFAYDTAWLKRDGYSVNPPWFDTMVAMHAAWPQMPKDLATLASLFTNEPYWKDERKDAKGIKDWTQYWNYNCLSGKTQILKADLTWCSLKDINVGDKLLSFEEKPVEGKTRKFKTTEVTKKASAYKKTVGVRLSNGTLLQGTPDHKVVRRKRYNGKFRGAVWTELGKLRPGDLLSSLGTPFKIENSFVCGWVSGMFDGEGTLAFSNGKEKSVVPHARVGLSQKEGRVFDAALSAIHHYGFKTSLSNKGNAKYIDVQGGLSETVRALGIFRPIRLLKKFLKQADIGWGGFQQLPTIEVVEVLDIKGLEEVYDITTTIGTFIADGVIAHNCKDTSVTLECVEPLQNEIDKQKSRGTFDFEMKLIPKFVNQTLRGINFDTALRNEFRKETKKALVLLESELDALVPSAFGCMDCDGTGSIQFGRKNKEGVKETKKCKACKGTGRHVNARSPAQLKQLIYKHMELPAVLKKGKQSVDEDAILKLEAKRPDPIFKKIIDIRGLSNRLGFLNVKIDADKRIRTSLSCTAYTGRLTSSGSPFGTGRNLQNVTRSSENTIKISKGLPLRRLFRADPGHIFYGPDYSKVEAYVMAYESNDAMYIDALVNGDIHKKNASVIFGKPQGEITDDERQLGKRICHGTNYGMGSKTMCDYIIKEMGPNYAITQTEAKRFAEAYFEEYKGLRLLQDRVRKQLEDTRVLVNSFGRRCTFLGRPTGSTIKEAFAFLPQSTSADLCNRAILRVAEMVPEVEFMLQIHDQLLLQAREDVGKERLKSKIVKAMTIPITAHYTGHEYIIPIDMKIGPTWEDLK